MPTEIFNIARTLDLAKLCRYAQAGGDVNVLDDSGESLLTVLLCAYEEAAAETLTPEEAAAVEQAEQNDDEAFWDGFLCREATLPLAERSLPILQTLDTLFAYGADANASRMTDGMRTTPLFHSVTMLDLPMTEYLLQKGADPALQLHSDAYLFNGRDMWLMEHLDIHLMDRATGSRAGQILRMAEALRLSGLTGWSGYCLYSDPETGRMASRPLRVKF